MNTEKIESTKAMMMATVQKDIRDDIVPPLCERVVFFLLSESARNLTYLNYGTLRQELDFPQQHKTSYKELVATTHYLTSNKLKLLEMHFHYVDDQLDEPAPIPDEDMAETFATGRFFHPMTGKEVEDFESKVFPYFEPSESLRGVHER